MLTAVVIALAIWAVARFAGAGFLVPAWDGSQDQVGPVDVIVMATVASLAGWALLAVMERFVSRALRVWTITAATVTALSIVPLVLMTGSQAPPATTIPLALMHIAVGATVISFFRRSAVNTSG